MLVAPSRREGFCLPLLEYQALGCPVIASDAHAQKELVGDRKARVKGQFEWSAGGTFEFIPEEKLIVRALQYHYKNRGGASDRSMVDVASYAIDRVIDDHVLQILDVVGDKVLGVETDG